MADFPHFVIVVMTLLYALPHFLLTLYGPVGITPGSTLFSSLHRRLLLVATLSTHCPRLATLGHMENDLFNVLSAPWGGVGVCLTAANEDHHVGQNVGKAPSSTLQLTKRLCLHVRPVFSRASWHVRHNDLAVRIDSGSLGYFCDDHGCATWSSACDELATQYEHDCAASSGNCVTCDTATTDANSLCTLSAQACLGDATVCTSSAD